MELIDTHCHLYSDDFKADTDLVIDAAKGAGVTKIFLPNIDRSSIPAMLSLEIAYPEYCFPMMGLHPCSVKADFRDELQTIEQQLSERRFVAIGETGLDFYWDTRFAKEQEVAFGRQLEWAKGLSVPIVIHCRNSMDEAIAMVKRHQHGGLRGIFHCFSGSVEQAHSVIDLGFLLGIGGVVSFKKGGLDQILSKTGLASIVLETDAPYLAPVPFRGKRNQPAYLTYVVKKVAEYTQREEADVARITTANAKNIFGVAG